VEGLGGMTRAVVSGMPKQRIEEAAARRQARVERGEDTIVGVNKYQVDGSGEQVDVLAVDNDKVRNAQLRRLTAVRASRDEVACQGALDALTEGAKNNTGNLLELSINAVRARATVGEVSDALEKAYGRHQAVSKRTKGVYANEYGDAPEFSKVSDEVKVFTDIEGRAPAILVVKMGQDGHDRGAQVIANAFTDFGFDVSVGPLFQTPQEAADMTVAGNVHVIGISTLAGGHKALVPELIAELKTRGKEDVVVVCGGVIPQQDYQFLYDAGVDAIYGPGSNIPEAASRVLELIPGRNR
ncbi:MAG: methylmalonyl-CoA mutase family protein, partial [Pseudomonadales bacterium]